MKEGHLFWRDRALLVFFVGLQCPIQRGSGDLECLANFRNRVAFVVEILSNTKLFAGEGFGSTASSPPGYHKSCLGSFPNKVSFKFNLMHPP